MMEDLGEKLNNPTCWKWIYHNLNATISMNETLEDFKNRISVQITNFHDLMKLTLMKNESYSCQICTKSSEIDSLTWFINGLNPEFRSQFLNCQNICDLEVDTTNKANEILRMIKIENDQLRSPLGIVDDSDNQIWDLIKDKLTLIQKKNELPSEFYERVEISQNKLYYRIKVQFHSSNPCEICRFRNKIESLTWFIHGLISDEIKSSLMTQMSENAEQLSEIVSLADHKWKSINPVFTCTQCSSKFSSDKLLAQHFKSTHSNSNDENHWRANTDYLLVPPIITQCVHCPLKFESNDKLRKHCETMHGKTMKAEIQNFDSTNSTMDLYWIKRKRDLYINENEPPEKFVTRIENVVLAAHHDLSKYTKKPDKCQTCEKRNEIECLQLFLNGINSEYQEKIELKLEKYNQPTVDKAVQIMSEFIQIIEDDSPINKSNDQNVNDDIENINSINLKLDSNNFDEQNEFHDDDQDDDNQEDDDYYDDNDDSDYEMEDKTKAEEEVEPVENEHNEVVLEFEGIKYCKLPDDDRVGQMIPEEYDAMYKEVNDDNLKTIEVKDSKGNTSIRHPCPYCEITTCKQAALNKHIILNHKKIKRYVCLICQDYGYNIKSSIINHAELKHKGKRKLKYKCDICGEKTQTLGLMKSHKTKLHRVNSRVVPIEPVEICGMNYMKLEDPLHHIAELNEKDLNVMSEEVQNTHNTTVKVADSKSGKMIKMYNCTLCTHREYNMSRNSDRIAHILSVHKKIRRYRCLICFNFGTWNLGGTIKHVNNVHNKVRNFKCDECDFVFSTNQSLKVHISAVHRKERNFICDTCGKDFGSNATLIAHTKTVHEKQKNVMCNLCGQQFFSKAVLKRHMEGKHIKARVDCPYCGVAFAKLSLDKHIKSIHMDIAPMKCKHCSSTYRHESSLRKHMKKNHPGLKLK